MRRRDFLKFLGCAAAWVSTARGEEPSHVVGFLSAFFAPGMPGALAAFYQGLKETGFVEGKNISVEFRWADGHYDRLPTLAAELVERHVSVIFAIDLPSAFAAKAATKTPPIVFVTGADPVKAGLVESLSRSACGHPPPSRTGGSHREDSNHCGKNRYSLCAPVPLEAAAPRRLGVARQPLSRHSPVFFSRQIVLCMVPLARPVPNFTQGRANVRTPNRRQGRLHELIGGPLTQG